MKFAARFLSLMILAGAAAFYISCDGGDGGSKSPQEKQFDLLKGSWTLQSASLDGTNKTSDYSNLVLTLAGTFAENGIYDYSFTGTRPIVSPWPASGKWKFGTDPVTDIIRDPNTGDEIAAVYTLTSTTLTVSFDLPAGKSWSGGRVGSVEGSWEFVFEK